jgi:hypothetical protein
MYRRGTKKVDTDTRGVFIGRYGEVSKDFLQNGHAVGSLF